MSQSLTRRGVLAGAAAIASAPLCAQESAISRVIHEVEIRDLAFTPATIEAQVGDSIRWTNADIAPHTATALDGSWDTGRLAQGESAVIEVIEAMSGAYRCRFHPHMTGVVAILPA